MLAGHVAQYPRLQQDDISDDIADGLSVLLTHVASSSATEVTPFWACDTRVPSSMGMPRFTKH